MTPEELAAQALRQAAVHATHSTKQQVIDRLGHVLRGLGAPPRLTQAVLRIDTHPRAPMPELRRTLHGLADQVARQSDSLRVPKRQPTGGSR